MRSKIVFTAGIVAVMGTLLGCGSEPPAKQPESKLAKVIETVCQDHYLYDTLGLTTSSATVVRLKPTIWENPDDMRALLERVADTVKYHPSPGHLIAFASDGGRFASITFEGNTPRLVMNYETAKIKREKAAETERIEREKAVESERIKGEKAAEAEKIKEAAGFLRRQLIVPPEIEDFFLNEMKWDTKVESFGDGYTALRIEYILMGRVLANELSKSALIDRLKLEGFTHVVFTDGYDRTYPYEIH